MSTRSEQFKTEAQRASSKKKRAAPKKAAPKKAAPTKAKKKPATPLTRNASKAAGRKASFALEASAERPSRKSTRASANRQKPDSNLKRRETRRVSSPKRRATSGR